MGDTENEEKRVDTVKDYTDEFEGRSLTGEFSLTKALVVFVSLKSYDWNFIQCTGLFLKWPSFLQKNHHLPKLANFDHSRSSGLFEQGNFK